MKALRNNKGIATLAVMVIFAMLGIAGSQINMKGITEIDCICSGEIYQLSVPFELADIDLMTDEICVFNGPLSEGVAAYVMENKSKTVIAFYEIVTTDCPAHIALATISDYGEETIYYILENGAFVRSTKEAFTLEANKWDMKSRGSDL